MGRNFNTVSDRIIQIVRDNHSFLEDGDREVVMCLLVIKAFGWEYADHIVERFWQVFQEVEGEGYMNFDKYNEFIEVVKLIQTSEAYIAPEDQSNLWEKLGRRCQTSFGNIQNSWTDHVSRVIRGISQ